MLHATTTIRFGAGPRWGGRICAPASALLVVVCACSQARADQGATSVTVVLSGTASPYLQTQQSLVAELARRGHTVRTAQLTDLARRWTAPQARQAYVAVGTRAAVWLHSRVQAPGCLTYCMVAGPDRAGLTDERARHGVSTDVPVAAQFKVIAQTLPRARSVGMLYRGKSARSRAVLAEVRKAMPKGWRLKAVDIDAQRSVAAAIETLFERDVDIIWTAPDASVYNVATIRTLLLGAVRRKKAVFGFSPSFVRAGALIGVGVSPKTQGSQAAELADRAMRAKVATNAKVFPTAPKYQVAVNLIVAEKLSITIPRAVVKRAAHVFEAGNTGGRR